MKEVSVRLSCGCEYTLELEPLADPTPEEQAADHPTLNPAAKFPCEDHGVQVIMERT